MRKGRLILLLSMALLFGSGAAWFANSWVIQRSIPSVQASSMEAVVTASLVIPFGQKIEASHIKVVQMPVALVPDGAFSEITEVEGMIAKQEMVPGEVILSSRVAEHIGGSTLAAVINTNMRAVTLRVNDVIGVAGFLLPGNRVDILATRKVNKRAQTSTLLQNIKVLAVDQSSSPEKDQPVIVRAVTVEMTARQSESVVTATNEGSIQLTLRNPLDDVVAIAALEPEPEPEPVPVPTVELVEKKVAVLPVKKPAAHPTTDMTIIRGTTVEKRSTKI